jgi:two-component system, chemotaxis family, protein-glutamate methylesterase/glutaminase
VAQTKNNTAERRTKTDADAISILIVDDSAIARGFIARWLDAEPGLHVTATAASGDGALAMLRVNDFDVIVLDIEMPGMDGIAALPQILAIAPHVQIVMASTLTLRNAEISMRALELGAADYVTKPRSSLSADAGSLFRTELVAKVQSLGARARRLRSGASDAAAPANPRATPVANVVPVIGLRKASNAVPKILAIGSSTGGPQALFTMLGKLARPFPVPIVITQHMPATFTAILAQHIERLTGFSAVEASQGIRIEAGRVYVAPGDHHLEFTGEGGLRASVTQDAPVNFCRPAVDPMFSSLVKIYGDAVLGVVLTGMGKDGTAGATNIVAAGGNIFSQDEESSVVWGMPRAVAQAGLSCFVGPLHALADQINALFALGTRS